MIIAQPSWPVPPAIAQLLPKPGDESMRDCLMLLLTPCARGTQVAVSNADCQEALVTQRSMAGPRSLAATR